MLGSGAKVGVAVVGGACLSYAFILYFYNMAALAQDSMTSPNPNTGETMMTMMSTPSSSGSGSDSGAVSVAVAGDGSGAGETQVTVKPTTPFDIFSRSNCRKFVMILAKRLMKVLNACVRVVKESYPDDKRAMDTYFQCAIKCALNRIKMTDENFSMTNETFVTFTQVHVNPKYHPLIMRIGKRCIAKYTSIITNIDDPYCHQHGDFVKCLQEDLSEQC